MADAPRRARHYIPRSWSEVIDLALILWITRVPVGALLVGFALLYLVPQAQDLLVELIESPWHVVLFLTLVFSALMVGTERPWSLAAF